MNNVNIDELLEKKRQGPTFFQLRFFVIGKEPTTQAKMHKCLDEIKQRQSSIQAAQLEIEEADDIIALHKIEIDKIEKGKAIKIEKEIRSRQINRKITSTKNHIKTMEERVKAWDEEVVFLKELYDSMAKTTELKNWNGFDVQFEYWNEKIAQEMRQRLLMNAPIDMEIIKTALSLPDISPIKKQLLEHIEKKAITDK